MVEYRIPLDTSHPFQLRNLCLWLVAGVILLALAVYVAYQARFLLLGPQITVDPPPAAPVLERTVTISGTAHNIARITLNGRQIFTNPDGVFDEVIVLGDGYNVVTIAAVDRYGRTNEVEHAYVYEPTSLIQ